VNISLHAAMVDPALMGETFGGASWAAWRAVAKAIDGEAVTGAEAELLARLSGRSAASWAVGRRFREAYFVCGRRSGKSLFTAAVGLHAAILADWGAHLAPGQRPVVAIVAATTDQAGVIAGYCAGLAKSSVVIASEVVRQTATCIEFASGASVEVHANSFRSIRGRSFAAVLVDELAFLRSDDSASPDTELRRAALPGLLPGARLIGISSPWSRRGLLYAVHARHYGREDAAVLVLQADTLTMNPTFSAATIAEAQSEDAVLARTEFGAQFREDLRQFLDDATIERAVPAGVVERPRVAALPDGGAARYVAFADLSGGRHDAAALAVAHQEGGRAVLDKVVIAPAPHSPAEVVERFAAVLRDYGLGGVTADGYAGNFAVDAFAGQGVACQRSALDRSAIYAALVPYFAQGRVEVLDVPRLLHELRGLERRALAGGRERIDHAPGGHDDAINAAAGALLLAARAPVAGARTVALYRSAIWSEMSRELGPLPGREHSLDLGRFNV